MNNEGKKEARQELEARGKFEHELLNRRVTWLLSSQTILFAAYGLSFSSSINEIDVKNFREVIPTLGIIISFVIWIGINAAFYAKYKALSEFKKKDPEFENAQLGVKTWITFVGYLPDFSIPLIFICAWYYLLPICQT